MSLVVFIVFLYSIGGRRTTKQELDNLVATASPFVGQLGSNDALEAMLEMLVENDEKGPKAEKAFISRTIGKGESVSLKHVNTVEDVVQAVRDAKQNNQVLRTAGSEHSPPKSIFPENGVTLLLTGELRKVEMIRKEREGEEEWLVCRIGGGCYLGYNPSDSQSTVENSASYQVDEEGFAFPILGGEKLVYTRK